MAFRRPKKLVNENPGPTRMAGLNQRPGWIPRSDGRHRCQVILVDDNSKRMGLSGQWRHQEDNQGELNDNKAIAW